MSFLTFFGPKITLQQETLDWIARCPANFRRDYWVYITRVNQFITIGKRDGWWQKADEIWLMGAPLQSVANLGLKDNHDLTPVNAPIWGAGYGYLFDGATNYCNTGIDLSTAGGQYAQNDSSLYAWVLNDRPGIYYIAGATSAGARAAIRSRNGVSALFNANSSTGDPMRVLQTQGMVGYSRRNATGYRGFKSGALGNFTRPSAPLPTGPFRIGRLGTGASYSLDQVAILFIGAGLSEAQTLSLYNAKLAYLTAIGAISDDNQETPDPFSYGAFDQSELANVSPAGIEIAQQAPPPPDDSFTGSNFIYFPMTISSSQGIELMVSSTRTDIKGEHFIWGYRHKVVNNSSSGFPNPRPNLIYKPIRNAAGQECRIFYSTRAKARAAWIVAQRYSAGALPRADVRYPGNKGWLDVADDAGFDTSGWTGKTGDDLVKDTIVDTSGGLTANIVLHHAHINPDPLVGGNPEPYFTTNGYGLYRTGEDIIYLPVARAVDSTSVIVDSFLRDTEDQTLLTPDELKSTLLEAAESCHATGHKLNVYMNPLNAAGALATGMDVSVGYDILQAVDHLSIVAWPNNAERDVVASLNNQWTMLCGPAGNLSPDPLKIELVVGIGATGQEMTIADAYRVRNWFVGKGIRRVNFWRFYAVQGGDRSRQVNQVIAIILGLDPNAPNPTPIGTSFDFSKQSNTGLLYQLGLY